MTFSQACYALGTDPDQTPAVDLGPSEAEPRLRCIEDGKDVQLPDEFYMND